MGSNQGGKLWISIWKSRMMMSRPLLIPKCPIPARPRGPAPQADDAQRWQVLFSTLGWT